MTTVTLKLGRKNVTLERPRIVGQPLMVSYGMGTDSTAVLVLLWKAGIVPDVILFADTGDEKPETYAYIATINAWLASIGFPLVTVVKNNSKLYDALSENCLVNSTLPSLAFGMKGCSQKWKVQVMNTWANSWLPARLAWEAGLKCLKLIGYDAGPADSRRSEIATDAQYDYTYLLREKGIKREDCYKLIEEAGLPQPGKSACYHCPASKRAEVVTLAQTHPELAARAIKIEAKAEGYPGRAATEKKEGRQPGFLTTLGLGRTWSWRSFLAEKHPALMAKLLAEQDCGQEYFAAADVNRASQPQRLVTYLAGKLKAAEEAAFAAVGGDEQKKAAQKVRVAKTALFKAEVAAADGKLALEVEDEDDCGSLP